VNQDTTPAGARGAIADPRFGVLPPVASAKGAPVTVAFPFKFNNGDAKGDRAAAVVERRDDRGALMCPQAGRGGRHVIAACSSRQRCAASAEVSLSHNGEVTWPQRVC
jgi:hypothetical protein